MGNGEGLSISHLGTSTFCPSSQTFLLRNLLHVPLITKNLLSVSQFANDNNVFFEFHPQLCLVKDLTTQTVLLQGKLHKGLYQFQLGKPHTPKPSSVHCHLADSTRPHTLPSSSSILMQWHSKLGYPPVPIVTQILKQCNVPFSRNENFSLCTSSQLGKMHQLPFPTSHTKYSAPFQLIFADVWGPAHKLSSNGSRFYVSFVDAYTRYTWIYFLKLKSEVHKIFQIFHRHILVQFKTHIQILQTDGGVNSKACNPSFKPMVSNTDLHALIHHSRMV